MLHSLGENLLSLEIEISDEFLIAKFTGLSSVDIEWHRQIEAKLNLILICDTVDDRNDVFFIEFGRHADK